MTDDTLWEGCPKCGWFGDRRYRFVRRGSFEEAAAGRSLGEEGFESTRIIAEQRTTIKQYQRRVRMLLDELEALKLQQREPPAETNFEPIRESA